MSVSRWVQAGGEHQVPFLAAAARAAKGQVELCPKCGRSKLRYYFHEFAPDRHRGSLWVWCPSCATYATASRVSPTALMPMDPFAALPSKEFAQLELDTGEPLLDRLDKLWEAKRLP
jgi:hypothetical protein